MPQVGHWLTWVCVFLPLAHQWHLAKNNQFRNSKNSHSLYVTWMLEILNPMHPLPPSPHPDLPLRKDLLIVRQYCARSYHPILTSNCTTLPIWLVSDPTPEFHSSYLFSKPPPLTTMFDWVPQNHSLRQGFYEIKLLERIHCKNWHRSWGLKLRKNRGQARVWYQESSHGS